VRLGFASEPLAIRKNRAKSSGEKRSNPSAMFAGIDVHAALT
jgi:hypothetical protein